MIRRPPRPPLFPSTPLSRSVHDVGEQHRDLLALTLERAAGAEYLLGEMPRGGDVRPARRLGRRASAEPFAAGIAEPLADRKSTRLNSSHSQISYAVFCLEKK